MEALKEVGIEELEVYIIRRKITVTKFISTRTIMELCLEAERHPVDRVTKMWWEQDGLHPAASRISAAGVQ